MTGFVYFMRAGGFVKIGFSKNPRRRKCNIGSGSPFDVVLAAYFPGTERDEADLHSRFRPARQKGEWFKSCAEIEALIQLHAVVDRHIKPSWHPIKKFRMQHPEIILPRELAEMIGVERDDVLAWERRHKPIPDSLLPVVSQITGVAICELIRPVSEQGAVP